MSATLVRAPRRTLGLAFAALVLAAIVAAPAAGSLVRAAAGALAHGEPLRVHLLAFPLLALVAVWVFRGLVAALLALLVGAVTIVGTLAVLRVIGETTRVPIDALDLAVALGLGLAVDYCLLIVSRYREEIARTGPGPAALERTLASAGRTVAVSSLTVAAVLGCLLVFPRGAGRILGLAGITVAPIAGATTLTVLPPILTLLRWRINSGSPGRWRRLAYERAQPSLPSGWHRIARLVVRRPLWVALASGAILAGLAAPVTGLRVTQVDLASHLPLALALLIVFTTTTVFAITGSIVLAVEALLENVLTIAAALGALALALQDGALAGLLGDTSSRALAGSTLVSIFAVSCALASDHGICLLSRIKEARDGGASDTEAVASGLERTGRIVTAAALLVCIALASPMSAGHAMAKELGLGAALAVAIDATLVRALLLPSLMCLLGGLGWYSPPALRRFARAGRAPNDERRPRAASPTRSTHAVRLTPGGAAAAEPGHGLAVTPYCDHDSDAIRACLRQLVERVEGSGELVMAVAAFEFVRDRVLYAFGPWGVPASRTLARGEGTCTNKANLLVAVLRAAGIPAAYGVMRVDARRYFGVVGPKFLTRYASRESVHVYGAAFLNGRWVKCDPSTDRDLASRTAQFCPQTCLIEWDGVRDSLDFLEPRHVYADLGLYANIDEMLARPARSATPQRLALANDWLDFIRSQPPFASDEALVRAYRSAERTAAALAGPFGWLHAPSHALRLK